MKNKEGTDSQEDDKIVANLCFMADIVSDEESDVTPPEKNLHLMNFR